MVGVPELSEDDPKVAQGWARFAQTVESLRARVDSPGGLAVLPGSSLARDDALTDPYRISHAIQTSVVAATDHLDAVRQLVVVDQVLHTAATWTLARSALENLAVAYWLLTGDRRARVERLLSYQAQNANDARVAAREPEAGIKQRQVVRDRLTRIAAGAEVAGTRYISGFKVTTVLKWTDDHAPTRPLWIWRVCSGLAHGRQWAYLGALDQDHIASAEPGVTTLKLTSSYVHALIPVLDGAHLATEVFRIFDLRSGRVSS